MARRAKLLYCTTVSLKSAGTNEKGRQSSDLLRLLACLACILLFCAGIWAAVNTGFARLFSYTGEAVSSRQQPQAVAEQLMDLAVSLAPRDPSVHYSRALVILSGRSSALLATKRATSKAL